MDVLLATLPFFALVLVGWGACRFGVLNAGGAVGINRYAYYFALPAFLFLRMSATPPGEIFQGAFVAAYLTGGVITFVIGFLAVRALLRDVTGRAVAALAGCYGNVGFLAIPLLTATVGDHLAVPLALVLTLDIVVLVPIGLFVIEAGRGEGHIVARVGVAAVRVVFTNPLVIAIFAGMGAAAAGVTLPGPLETFADLLGRTAGPCAMFALGATLAGRPMSSGFGVAAAMSGIKLLVYPVVMAGSMTVFGVAAPWSTAAILAASMPIAAVLFVLAQQYDARPTEASTAVLLSTAIAVVTVPLAIRLVGAFAP